jgi:hypothetical protein
MNTPRTQQDALTLALKLAITATDERRTALAVQMAEELSESMTELEVARCKVRALDELGIPQ